MRVARVASNWYTVAPVFLGVRKRTVVNFRNGLRFVYANGLFSVEHFLEQPYALADVKGRDVFDVGAFVADSVVYFVWKGARRVIAFEPVPASFAVALENLRLNAITNVEIFNEAIGPAEARLILAQNMPGDSGFSAASWQNESVGERKTIRVRSLASMVEDFKPNHAVLKLDCQGDEYAILLNVERELLLPFDQIILEYHRLGPDLILERLNSVGFDTTVTDVWGRTAETAYKNSGLIYAVSRVGATG